MAAQERLLCCGCLLADRKMTAIEEFWLKQCFLQILQEIPMCQPEDVPVWLCWECEAQLRRFNEFKQLVKYSYISLQECGELKPDIKIARAPKLTVCKLNNINFPESEDLDLDTDLPLTEEIKIETSKDNQIKTEFDSLSDQDNEDDLLINYVTKKKKAVKKKKKAKVQFDIEINVSEQTPELYKEVELTDTEIDEERQEMALRDEYVNAMFRCEKCILSYPNADDLKDHIAVKHELNAAHHKCPICTCSFVSEISYNYHTNKHRKRYQCCMCAVRLRSKRAAQKHYDTTHVTDATIEDHDTQETTQIEDTANTNGVKSVGTFPCELCAKTFKWKTSLRKHLEKHRIDAGQKRRPYCEPCKLSFTTTSNLQKHVKTSSKHQIQLKLRKLKDTLPEDATTPEKHKAHIEEIKCSVNSARQQYPCAHCGKRFQWRGNLLRHMHSHTARANGELVCAPCSRTFSSLATYTQHVRLSRAHVSERELPHACADCGRRFANKTRLRDHVDWDHRRVFAHHCDQCQKVFKSHTSLYLHMQVVHKKEHAEHLCDHCGKSFANRAKLRSHIIALHTSSSPYKCGSCAARFSWHSCLSRHVRRVHKRK